MVFLILMPGIVSKVVIFLNVVSLLLCINVLNPRGLSRPLSVFTCQNVTEGVSMSDRWPKCRTAAMDVRSCYSWWVLMLYNYSTTFQNRLSHYACSVKSKKKFKKSKQTESQLKETFPILIIRVWSWTYGMNVQTFLPVELQQVLFISVWLFLNGGVAWGEGFNLIDREQ